MHEHDKIAQRLGMLLTRLYSGEKLHLSDLATEYNVTVRTLQRDFNQRLSYLPIEHRNQQYWLDPGFLNHKSDGKLRKLAEQLGITDDDMADVGDSEIYEHPAQYGHVFPRIWRGEQ